MIKNVIARHVSAGLRALFDVRVPLGTALLTLHATLREIFDEAAYERYLQRTGNAASRESFAAFLAAGKQARERKPRCC